VLARHAACWLRDEEANARGVSMAGGRLTELLYV
jgi:hypothetical protein